MINGVKFFAMGADYIPEDCVYNRITRERMEYLVRSSVKAHYNCLRVWGGGYYPSDEFYDLCDEYGIIVWQDLMYACNVYDFTEEFEKNISQTFPIIIRQSPLYLRTRLKNSAAIRLQLINIPVSGHRYPIGHYA